jgi:hypothetical protein
MATRKIDVALELIEEAIVLYLDRRSPYAALYLAAAEAEVFGRSVELLGRNPASPR